jgi:hypothetical protein
MKWALILFVGLSGVLARCSLAQSTDEPAANPGRPTVSTPATLTPVGYLQFETGVLRATGSPGFSWQYGLVETTKLSVASRLQFLASDQPVARSSVDDVATNATGDVLLGAQGVLFPGEGVKPTLAVSYFHRVYSGDAPDLDFGTPSNSLTLLASADVKGFRYDTNAFFNELVDGSVRRPQFGQTLSISHNLTGKLSISGEIWHFTQPFLRGHAIGNLWAVGYTARPDLVFDAGFNRGLTSTSTQWEAFAGFTYLLPHRLWKDHPTN